MKNYPLSSTMTHKKAIQSFFVAAAYVWIAQCPASAAIRNAASCQLAAVQSAVALAVVGDTVRIPAGQCDWGSGNLAINAGIYLQGSGRDATLIHASTGTGALITVSCSNGKPALLSDIGLTGKANPAIWDGGLNLTNDCQNFMVFNSRFSDFVDYGLSVRGNAKGVIYQNEFLNNYRPGQVGGATGYGVVVYGNGTWTALELGTEKAVFVEDNYFHGNRHAIASNNGSTYVFRYNTVISSDSVRHFSMVDAHGLSSSPRGSRSWEIYENKLTAGTSAAQQRSAIGIRGGDGVVFNNTITNPAVFARIIELLTEGGTTCPIPDQMTQGYFWSNSPQIILNSSTGCLVEGTHYFQSALAGYKPYAYPHPLRMPPANPRGLKIL
jgi:hypothetical protein